MGLITSTDTSTKYGFLAGMLRAYIYADLRSARVWAHHPGGYICNMLAQSPGFILKIQYRTGGPLVAFSFVNPKSEWGFRLCWSAGQINTRDFICFNENRRGAVWIHNAQLYEFPLCWNSWPNCTVWEMRQILKRLFLLVLAVVNVLPFWMAVTKKKIAWSKLSVIVRFSFVSLGILSPSFVHLLFQAIFPNAFYFRSIKYNIISRPPMSF